ncbi:hypothetical protein [Ruegeria arenilitoris]|uniref:hypothetical protein n=1 Tax=Ruegeria arenilitoris TaxID=1173585 RepID=UPI001C2BC04C|nr:hypothetical protein [Ruegeria arenilitoris]
MNVGLPASIGETGLDLDRNPRLIFVPVASPEGPSCVRSVPNMVGGRVVIVGLSD